MRLDADDLANSARQAGQREPAKVGADVNDHIVRGKPRWQAVLVA